MFATEDISQASHNYEKYLNGPIRRIKTTNPSLYQSLHLEMFPGLRSSAVKDEVSEAPRPTSDTKPKMDGPLESADDQPQEPQLYSHQKSSSNEDADEVVQGDDDNDAGTDYDGDSAYGGDDFASETASLSSSVLRYRQENGRTYHSYGMHNPELCFWNLS